MVSYSVYSEVRGCRAFTTPDLLREALRDYSPEFIFTSFGNCHSYLLFEEIPSLISVNYYPKVNPLFKPNIIAVFTSNSEGTSRNLAERFEKKTDLEFLTKLECPMLWYISVGEQESLFRDFMDLLASQPSLISQKDF